MPENTVTTSAVAIRVRKTPWQPFVCVLDGYAQNKARLGHRAELGIPGNRLPEKGDSAALNSGNDGARRYSVMERNAERELFFFIVGLVPRHKEAKNSREHRKDDDCRDDDRDFCRYPHRENRP